jgi:DNA-binding beta-propeller fold protein YncE
MARRESLRPAEAVGDARQRNLGYLGVMTLVSKWGAPRTLTLSAGLGVAFAVALAPPLTATATEAPLLTVEMKVPLGEVSGRIDHLAYDAARMRLYVAELGNDTVGIVDLRAYRVVRTVAGFKEPQGIGYEPATDTVYVANGGDGSVRLFSGADFEPLGMIALGDDADNVRIDVGAHRVYVGYGNGALAVIDPATRKRVADIALEGHPESFRLDTASPNIFVNVPDAKQIAVVSRETNRQIASWETGGLRSNYPLAIDSGKARVMSVFRHPARLQAYEPRTGRVLGGSDVCGDSDDLFVDAQRHRVYVICGDGNVDVLDASGDDFRRLARIATSSGSRTGLFVPEIDRLVVAIRATGTHRAALWLLRTR